MNRKKNEVASIHLKQPIYSEREEPSIEGFQRLHSENGLTERSQCGHSGAASQIFENQLFSYEQAAQYLAVSMPYLRKLKARGKIPYVQIGERGIRFRVGSLNQWIEKREVK